MKLTISLYFLLQKLQFQRVDSIYINDCIEYSAERCADGRKETEGKEKKTKAPRACLNPLSLACSSRLRSFPLSLLGVFLLAVRSQHERYSIMISHRDYLMFADSLLPTLPRAYWTESVTRSLLDFLINQSRCFQSRYNVISHPSQR